MMRHVVSVLAAIALVVAPLAGARAQNLITNPGFETGNFSGWTTVPATLGSDFGVSGTPHSGTFAAFFGAVTPPFDDAISQDVATTPGDLYDFDFWLRNDGGPRNHFQASFDGVSLLNLVDQSAFAYTHFTFTAPATSSTTAVRFAAYQVPSFWRLDDVTVLDLGPAAPAVPEPGPIAALLGMGVPAAGLLLRRKRRA